MDKRYLSKNDFIRWRSCPTAAHHGWAGMPSRNDNDAFLQFLAEEGKIIGKAAQRLFSGGQLIKDCDPKPAAELTRQELSGGDVTLFEGCTIDGDFAVRPDILVKRGETIYLIEVKSKVGNLHAHREGRMLINYYGDVRAAWREIVNDITFQVEVLSRAFPDCFIVPYLLLPEGSSVARSEEIEAVMASDFSQPHSEAELRGRRQASVLKFFPVSLAVDCHFAG